MFLLMRRRVSVGQSLERMLWTAGRQQITKQKVRVPRNTESAKPDSKIIEDLNRLIISKEVESTTKIFPTVPSPRAGGFTGEFCLTFEEGINTNLSQTLPKDRKGESTSYLILWC